MAVLAEVVSVLEHVPFREQGAEMKGGKMLTVWWGADVKAEVSFEWAGRMVVCRVAVSDGRVCLGRSVAGKHDLFVKERGRRLALERAIRGGTTAEGAFRKRGAFNCVSINCAGDGALDREFRRIVWAAYFATKKHAHPFWRHYTRESAGDPSLTRPCLYSTTREGSKSEDGRPSGTRLCFPILAKRT